MLEHVNNATRQIIHEMYFLGKRPLYEWELSVTSSWKKEKPELTFENPLAMSDANTNVPVIGMIYFGEQLDLFLSSLLASLTTTDLSSAFPFRLSFFFTNNTTGIEVDM